MLLFQEVVITCLTQVEWCHVCTFVQILIDPKSLLLTVGQVPSSTYCSGDQSQNRFLNVILQPEIQYFGVKVTPNVYNFWLATTDIFFFYIN